MSAAELRLDLADLQQVLSHATRPSVKALIQKETARVETELAKAEKAAAPAASPAAAKPAMTSTKAPVGLPTVKISNYGWDESDKFVKVYITLKGAEKAAKENVGCEFTPNSFSLWAIVDGKKHEMTMKDLTREINVDASKCNQKTDMLVVMCRKAEEGKKWEYLTKTEKISKEKSKPKLDAPNDSTDPQESLMGLMKQMYDDGDDEMKRTIRKSWHESQSKKGMAGMPGMDGFEM